MKDPYIILNLPHEPENLSDAEVQTAYLELVRQYPPDRYAERFQQIRQAFELLETEKKRLAYDLFETPLPDREDLVAMLLADDEKPCKQRPSIELMRKLLR